MVAIFLERPERAFSKEAGEGSLLCTAGAGEVARLARCLESERRRNVYLPRPEPAHDGHLVLM